jgi:hypothetical protein
MIKHVKRKGHVERTYSTVCKTGSNKQMNGFNRKKKLRGESERFTAKDSHVQEKGEIEKGEIEKGHGASRIDGTAVTVPLPGNDTNMKG